MPWQGANDPQNSNGANKKTKAPPSLKSEFKFQQRPCRQWLIVQELGDGGGGCNEGIAKVELKDDPFDRVFIEKRFKLEQGLAEKEISLLNQLGDWPGVVKMVDHFIDERLGRASVYLEFCDAGDLEKVILGVSRDKQRVYERKIWQWFIGMMDTLVYMHRGPDPEDDRRVMLYWNCVYHRDIKPANILLKNEHKEGKIVAKMADFGCSMSAHWNHVTKRRTPHAISQTSVHTPGYDPPEHPEYSGATDVWQISLVVACVCTGIINPRSKLNSRGQEWNKSQPAGPQYSQKLNEILAWCLNEDKCRRPTPLEVSKRLKTEHASINLPPDNKPLEIFGEPGTRSAQTPRPVSSPGPAMSAQQPNFHEQRPGMPQHGFSDPEVQRMGHRGDQYSMFVQDQRFPSPPALMNEMMYGDGGHAPPRLLGGFIPGFCQSPFPPEFGQGGHFHGGPGSFPASVPGSFPSCFPGRFPDPRMYPRRRR